MISSPCLRMNEICACVNVDFFVESSVNRPRVYIRKIRAICGSIFREQATLDNVITSFESLHTECRNMAAHRRFWRHSQYDIRPPRASLHLEGRSVIFRSLTRYQRRSDFMAKKLRFSATSTPVTLSPPRALSTLEHRDAPLLREYSR
jgi:hypothetical protein